MFGLKRETPPSMAVVDRFDPLVFVLQSKQSFRVVRHAQPHAILQPSFWQEACFGFCEADAMPRARHQLRRCDSLAKRREATRSEALARGKPTWKARGFTLSGSRNGPARSKGSMGHPGKGCRLRGGPGWRLWSPAEGKLLLSFGFTFLALSKPSLLFK